jgi:hypothetical protein
VLQQTPSTQLLEAHWFAPLHVAPFVFLPTHAPPRQKAVVAQSASLAHDASHPVPDALQT